MGAPTIPHAEIPVIVGIPELECFSVGLTGRRTGRQGECAPQRWPAWSVASDLLPAVRLVEQLPRLSARLRHPAAIVTADVANHGRALRPTSTYDVSVIDFVDGGAAGDLAVDWIHGQPRRSGTDDPPIQVHRYDEHTIILRQSKQLTYEAPFLYLFFGNHTALLLDTGAVRTLPACRYVARSTN